MLLCASRGVFGCVFLRILSSFYEYPFNKSLYTEIGLCFRVVAPTWHSNYLQTATNKRRR